eukprot:TRINITY_DN4145_c0_g1_i2.p2 TRINITY_DN4145_c0_g1~~TRINITY_DN4145_c0_g1_i2.p2  ORF type:complete len:330 (+),score=53.27 TRINITY_DN4145_c0_g1_i2:53-991(+)
MSAARITQRSSVSDVASFIDSIVPGLGSTFQRGKIAGRHLNSMTDERLERLGVQSMGDRMDILWALKNLPEFMAAPADLAPGSGLPEGMQWRRWTGSSIKDVARFVDTVVPECTAAPAAALSETATLSDCTAAPVAAEAAQWRRLTAESTIEDVAKYVDSVVPGLGKLFKRNLMDGEDMIKLTFDHLRHMDHISMRDVQAILEALDVDLASERAREWEVIKISHNTFCWNPKAAEQPHAISELRWRVIASMLVAEDQVGHFLNRVGCAGWSDIDEDIFDAIVRKLQDTTEAGEEREGRFAAVVAALAPGSRR